MLPWSVTTGNRIPKHGWSFASRTCLPFVSSLSSQEMGSEHTNGRFVGWWRIPISWRCGRPHGRAPVLRRFGPRSMHSNGPLSLGYSVDGALAGARLGASTSGFVRIRSPSHTRCMSDTETQWSSLSDGFIIRTAHGPCPLGRVRPSPVTLHQNPYRTSSPFHWMTTWSSGRETISRARYVCTTTVRTTRRLDQRPSDRARLSILRLARGRGICGSPIPAPGSISCATAYICCDSRVGRHGIARTGSRLCRSARSMGD